MSNGSPTAYLLWAILSVIFLVFLLLHLWAYDKFKCLKWDSGRQPGAFKRVMTYSYVATLPLLVIFSVAMTALKFKEGYWVNPGGHIIPMPLLFWLPEDRHWLLPLYFILSIGWSLEIVTHLEELGFWLFLLHQGPGKREWFHSWEFRVWYLGSIVAILGMPLITLVTRKEIERVQTWIFLAGSSAGTFTTIIFLYVLYRFPRFIQYVKDGGAEPDVVVRLATFYSLNRIRVMFRFFFTIPLLIIAVDAINAPFPILENPFALDFLLMMGGIGCFISSAITLLIFFPRSITRESGYKAKIVSPHNSAKEPTILTAASPLPDYSIRQQRSSKAYAPVSPTTGTLDTFRYPAAERDEREAMTPRAGHSSHNGQQRRLSMESASTSSSYASDVGAEADAESIELGSTSATTHTHVHLQENHALAPRQNSSQTYISRPTSGGRSDDTVWERQDDFSSSARRRHPDGPFIFNRHGATVHAISGHMPIPSEDGVRSNGRIERPATPMPSSLHPYVINFTSPIDLLDHSQDEQQPLHPVHRHQRHIV